MITIRRGRPLIGVLTRDEHDQEVVTYFTDEVEADLAIPDADVEAALALAGAWSDVPWEDLETGLDRIRHESEPTPPIEL